MVISGMPAMAMMSPGPADSAATRSSASVISSSVIFTRSTVPSVRHQATVWPLRISPWCTRQSARRPRYGEASRLVTCACRGALSSYVGAGTASRMVRNSVSRSFSSGMPPSSGRTVDARPALAEQYRIGNSICSSVASQVEEQLVGLVHHLGDAGVRPVDLVHHEHDRQLRLQRLAQHEPGLRQRTLARVDQQDDAVHHRQTALDLAAEVGVTRGVDDVDRDGPAVEGVLHGGVLREDRDALLALEVHRVHHPLVDRPLLRLVGRERAALPQHGVDQGGLAVVDVGDDRDVAQIVPDG